MSVNVYDKGDLLRITGTFTNASNAAIDPTVVLFKYRNPAGTSTTLTYGVDAALVKSATGIYYVDLDMSSSGVWYAKFQSTGTGQAAAIDTQITINDSVF
jgi:hypothetical protein